MPDKKLRSRDRRAGILARAEEIERLHKAVHETFANRHKREGGIEAWERAAAAFRQRSASFDGEMARVRSAAAMEADPALRDFVLTFLELDPMFFRSGYMKEVMLDQLKPARLSPDERVRVRAIVVDAARSRGQREFRRYCRLAGRLRDATLADTLAPMLEDRSGRVRSRARMMLDFVAPEVTPDADAEDDRDA